MRSDFDEVFARVYQRKELDNFWTLELNLGVEIGTLYLTDRSEIVNPVTGLVTPVVIDGQQYDAVVARWGTISSLQNREERVLDVPSVAIEFSNSEHALTSGERLSDLLQSQALETSRARIYLNVIDPDTGEIGRAGIFAGVVQSDDADPVAYDLRRSKISVRSLAEYYLRQTACRVITRTEFPAIREGDIGSTIPYVFGVVPRVLGRVAKTSNKTPPIADPANTSTARLLDYTVRPAANAARTYTVVFSEDEARPKSVVYDSEHEVGNYIGTPAVTAATSAATPSVAASLTVPAFDCAGGTILIVAIHRTVTGGDAVDTVTYGGRGLRHLRVDTYTAPSLGYSLWWYPAPPTGAHDVVVTTHFATSFIVDVVAMVGGMTRPQDTAFGDGVATAKLVSLEGLGGERAIDFAGREGSGNFLPVAAQTLVTGTSSTLLTGLHTGVSTRMFPSGSGDRRTIDMEWGLDATQTVDLEARRIRYTTRVCRQSFPVSSAQQISALKLRMRINPAYVALAREAAVTEETIVTAAIYADSGGVPTGEPLGFAAARVQAIDVTDTSGTESVVGNNSRMVPFFFPTGLNVAAGQYHIVVYTSAYGGTGAVLWAKDSTGSYADGTAGKGVSVGTEEPDEFRPHHAWVAGLSGEDFAFKVIFAAGATPFAVYSDVDGFVGAGSTDVPFGSTDGFISIDPSNWSGQPAEGDRFTFSIDPSPATVIFGESPAATPNRALTAFWWNDDAVNTTALDGADTVILPPSTNLGGQVYALGVDGIVGQVLVANTTRLISRAKFFLQTVGVAFGDVDVTIVRANVSGTAPSEASEQIAHGVIPLVTIPAGNRDPLDGQFIEVIFDTPWVRKAGVRYVALLSVTPDLSGPPLDESNAVCITINRENPYPAGIHCLLPNDASSWVSFTTYDVCMKLLAADITVELSADDGTGNLVTKATLDVPIPDDVTISASMEGWTDPTGTYTGTPGGLIRRPDSVVHALLNFWGVPDSEIDLAGSFATSATGYPSYYRFDGVAQDSGTRKALLLELGFESRSALSWLNLQARWSYLPMSLATVDDTLSKADVLGADGNNILVTVRRSPTVKVVNFIDLRYKRRHELPRALDSYVIVHAENAESIHGPAGDPSRAFGKRDDPEMFLCDFIRDDAMAADVAAYYAARLGFPLRIVEATTKRQKLRLQTDDRIAFDLRT